MVKLEMNGAVYSAEKAKQVAEQLQANECDGWLYVVEVKGLYGRVLVLDENRNQVGYF